MRSDLHAIDSNSNPAQLTFSVDQISNGYFVRYSDRDRRITSFTQADVDNAEIIFVHSGDGLPSYRVTVSDGRNRSRASVVKASFRD